DRIGLRGYEGHRPGPLLAEQLAAGRDVRHAPGIKCPESLVELLLAFEEELPFLRKRELEASQVDLFLIGFDGGEVGEQRAIDRGCWCEGVAGIDARFEVRVRTI